jgi:methylated-DNA-[protein]-cysteine S-methyltransferase
MPFTTFETALGPCALAWSDAGITWMQLPEGSREATVERLLAKAPDAGDAASEKKAPPWIKDAVARVRDHLGGRPQDFVRIPLDLARVSPFHAKIYRALQRIPAGSTVSYGELAGLAGSPGASRAVGRAMATNPFPIFVPCQRVLSAGGKVGGFSAYGGIETKQRSPTSKSGIACSHASSPRGPSLSS